MSIKNILLKTDTDGAVQLFDYTGPGWYAYNGENDTMECLPRAEVDKYLDIDDLKLAHPSVKCISGIFDINRDYVPESMDIFLFLIRKEYREHGVQIYYEIEEEPLYEAGIKIEDRMFLKYEDNCWRLIIDRNEKQGDDWVSIEDDCELLLPAESRKKLKAQIRELVTNPHYCDEVLAFKGFSDLSDK